MRALRRLGFDAWISYENDEEHFNLKLPRWIARRPQLVDRITAAMVKVISWGKP